MKSNGVAASLLTTILLAGCVGAVTPATIPAAATAGATPRADPTPPAAPTPNPTAGRLGMTWVTAAGAPPAVSVTAGGPGWVAVGHAPPADQPTTNDHVAAAWTSTDGLSWTRATGVAMPEQSMGGGMTAVTRSKNGIFAAGAVNLTAGVVWHSVDGATWEVIGSGPLFDLGPCVEGCAIFTSIAAAPSGIVVAGYRVLATGSDARTESDIWSSSDGTRWQRRQAPAPAGARANPAWVTAGRGGFVAAGTLCLDGNAGCRPVTWMSADGRSWTQPTDLPDAPNAYPVRVVAGADGFVVLGQHCDLDGCHYIDWASSDGTSWTPGDLATDNEISSAQGLLTASGGHYVVLASNDARVNVWTSDDGLAWDRQTPDPGALPPADAIMVLDIAGHQGVVLAIGAHRDPEAPGVWRSP